MSRPRRSDPPASPRAAAARLLSAVLDEGKTLEGAREGARWLDALSPRDRAFAVKLVTVTLGHLGRLDATIAGFLDKPPRGAAGRAATTALRLGAAQLLILNTPAHAGVGETLRLLDAGPGARLKGMVNAVLRRVAGEGGATFAALDPLDDVPDWLAAGWRGAYGARTARRIARAHAGEAPLDLSCKGDPAAWAERLGGRLLPTGTVRLAPGSAVPDLAGYREGAWWVQDAAARLPALLLDAPAGAAVLDLCAAPGGKTAQLAALGAAVTALDRSRARTARLADNLARLDLAATLVEADALTWRPAEPAGYVLLDAPCSASGTIRKHPDLPHVKRARDIAALATAQAGLLRAAAEMTAPGGRLVYAVCSLEPEEGEDQIRDFLARRDDFVLQPVQAAELPGFEEAVTPAGFLRTLPFHGPEGGCDGFFVARLTRLSR